VSIINWDFGDGGTSTLVSPSHTYLTSGNFQVRLIADNPSGCISSDTAYSTIRVIDAVDASFTSQIVLDCKNDTVHLTLNNPSSSPSVLYNWNFGDGSQSVINNPTHYYQNQGIYTITCIATNGFCHDTVKQTINTFHPINAVLGITKDSICLGDQLNADASQSVPQGFLSYTWIWGDGNITNSSNNSESHIYTADGEYTVMLIVTDTIGCHDTDTHKIFVDKPSFVNFSILDDEVCIGQPIQLLDTIAPHTISFEWDFGDGNKVSNVHNPKYNYDMAGNYNITLTGYYLVCTPLSKQLPVIIHDYPKVNLGPDTMMCPGLTGSITLSDNSSASSHIWSTGETTASIIATEPGRYWVEGSIGECKSMDSIWIKRDCYLNIPNSFSPNGDGLNDYFLPRELLSSGLTSFTMSIYNRWGEKIFATDKIDGRGWDGKFNGVNQPQGVYVYVIDAIFRSNLKKNFTGNVTLMR
jgi:gliding motility-associated-like protein